MSDAARCSRPARPATARARGLVGLCVLLGLAGHAWAAPPSPTAPATGPTVRPAPLNEGVDWKALSPVQRTALAPLERDWASLDAAQKLKWIELVQRFPKMPEDERARIQGRMAEWARMTPTERGKARLLFLQARRAEPDNRGARWEDYQALPSDRKEELAARAKAQNTKRNLSNNRPAGGEKSNLVTGPSYTLPPKPVAPTVIQARPGATTTLVSKLPSPPPHQQVGLPKIAATPGFIDKNTLLPRRGPQGAATLSVNSSATDLEPVPRP